MKVKIKKHLRKGKNKVSVVKQHYKLSNKSHKGRKKTGVSKGAAKFLDSHVHKTTMGSKSIERGTRFTGQKATGVSHGAANFLKKKAAPARAKQKKANIAARHARIAARNN